MKTAFVFAGGGSLGAVQVGMLKAVSEAGVFADMLVGASVGAINAGFFASDPTDKGALRLENIWKGIKRSDVFQVASITGLLGLFSLREYICSPKPLRHLIESNVNRKLLEDLQLPCHIVATDLFTGIEVSLSRGSIVSALLAASAIPTVFPPVKIGSHYLVDGSVTNNTPISVAVAKGADRILVFPTGMSCALKRPPKRLIEMAMQTLNLATSQRLVVDIENYSRNYEIIVLPPLCPLDVSIFNFSRTSELIERAESNTHRWISEGGLDGQTDAIAALRPHYH